MGAVVRFVSPRQLTIAQEPDRPLGPDEVRVRTSYSGISAGTELTAYRGQNPYLQLTWDDRQRLFVPGAGTLAYPIDGFGYEEVGRVVEVGRDDGALAPGDVVWGRWGHRETAVLSAGYASERRLRAETPVIAGIFSQIGAIALNVILDADIHVGETVAVFGLGVPGQLVAQLARLNGGRVIGVDLNARRRSLAMEHGCDTALDPADGEVAERVRDLTGGLGADVSIEVSGSYVALHEAIRAVAYNSRVVVAGFFQGEGRGLRLGEEAHHNRPQLVVSQIGGVAPQVAHRWNERRLQRAFMDLVEDGVVAVEPLISHVLPLAQAADAFRMLDEDPDDALQVVLEVRP